MRTAGINGHWKTEADLIRMTMDRKPLRRYVSSLREQQQTLRETLEAIEKRDISFVEVKELLEDVKKKLRQIRAQMAGSGSKLV